ncbi:unnamed protein product [Rotaria socialis]|uniref:Uncharacterized protein n=1 Tax=Rotaria socialis TaxID=392032 RepID=A0A821PRH4_9BILA|nr:unnamed protein product [Rotaria socialis]
MVELASGVGIVSPFRTLVFDGCELLSTTTKKEGKCFARKTLEFGLSDEEIQCLSNGLDYGLIPKRVDKLMIASNIEQFYHRVTDITQHH